MINVHHLNNSRSQRVLWLLEEIALPYEVVRYKRDPRTMLAPKSLREVHPLGKSPVIEDGSLRLAETGAIVDYLVARYGQALAPPPESDSFWRYRYWLHYAEGSAMPPLLIKADPQPARAARHAGEEGFVDSQIRLHLDYLERQLADRPWFVADAFSAADVMMSFPLEVATARAGLDATRPNLWNFLARIHARPAYRRALERGGDDALAGAAAS